MTATAKRTAAGALALAVCVTGGVLAVMGSARDTEPALRDPAMHSSYVDLPDGRVATCVAYDKGAVTCDWFGAVREGEEP